MTRKVVAGLLIGAGSSLLVLLLAWTKLGGLDRLDLQLYDWSWRRLANPDLVNQDIVLVEINDASIRDYAPAVGRRPWPRVLQSNLIDFLQRAPARVIAYDIQLSERSNGSFKFGDDTRTAEESDDGMVTSARTARNVILLADATNPGVTGGDSQQPVMTGRSSMRGPSVKGLFQAWRGGRGATYRARQSSREWGRSRGGRRTGQFPEPDASVFGTIVIGLVSQL